MKYVLKQLTTYFKEHKVRYAVVFGFMIIASAMYVAPIYILRLFIDALLQDDFSQAVLIRYSSLFAGAILLGYLAEFVWTFNLFIGSYDLQRKLRQQLMGHFLKMGAPFYQRFRTGDLMTRSSDDVQVMGMTVGYGLMVFLNTSLYLSFIVAMMAVTVSWQLTLIALIPMPLLAYYIFKWGSQVDKAFTEAQNSVSEMNSEVLEMIDGIRVVRAYGLEEETTKQFEDKTTETRAKNDIVSEIDSRFGPLITIILSISFVLSFGIGAQLVANQQITIGAMVSFQVYLTMVVWPMISAGDLVNVMQQGAASWRRINEVLQTDDQLEPDGSTGLAAIETISLNDYHFKYPETEREVLAGLDLTIQKGEVLGVVGKTGSGKTSLLRQFGHRYPYSAQMPQINGKALTQYTTETLRSQFAEVPQEHTLFSRTIKENLLFGQPDASEDALWAALDAACFTEDIKRMPEGLETIVGEKGVSLSGGQKQRLSLARAFLRQSEVLLLDDALSAVDAKTEQAIITNLKSMQHAPTSIIVTHRLSAITEADQIIVLDDGEISQRGTHQSLIQTPGWYQNQYYHQQLKEDDTDVLND
ncbi:ABC transporter ATP-binding protein [Enterococcus sp. RIT-PI-f]|jgi:ATP-binding cassette, subfamily B, multidrug efflux pump|uniref:ABC transporter ATP-binding protein n=1 Tax=Enterococcus sp. RIT-PI-f TaxID=1690244 RepID=UPI0006B9108D|nr:ABC transporter ATP-binding protein [Enterococcus sp. RIT-PI-f]KPG70033.1 ABC transporter ATP-binding protein [Enterococcus sp. RIT-PI-f]